MMKSTLLLSLFVLCLGRTVSAQVINVSPGYLVFTTPASTNSAAGADTITASGLVPSTGGTLTIEPPPHYIVSPDGINWDYSTTVAYTGSSLAPKVIYLKYIAPSSGGNWGNVTISGGGVSSPVNICVCGNLSTCPCATAAVATTPKQSTIISPNPANNIITVTAGEIITSIDICNIFGKVVYTLTCNSHTTDVPIEALPTGIYLIRINGAEVRKFVKE